ncbi:putative ATP-dependent RNA helicase DHR1 [Extremus antarcticus]|uniref:RNA helicase n=1 Tax=Extremus antarcticus TaxID=702011 RepID=A0AAJ0G5U1_9PEZI|nr:putative ATP-dependent RNA helicase DHR1 [Extremus antarcticus]
MADPRSLLELVNGPCPPPHPSADPRSRYAQLQKIISDASLNLDSNFENTTMPRFVPRERKRRVLDRAKATGSRRDVSHTNSDEIIPERPSERDARRNALREELRAAQPESKGSSKKRKRLDKYIDTKLKKDENADLIRKLEGQRIDTSLLQSSKKLGRVTESKRERFSRALREKQAGIDIDGTSDSILLERRAEVGSPGSSSESEDDEVAQPEPSTASPGSQGVAGAEISFGSGLKRPLDVGEDGRPAIRKRKRRKTTKGAAARPLDVEIEADAVEGDDVENITDQDEGEEEEWQGFSSDDDTTPDDTKMDDSDDSELSDDSSATSQDDRPARVSAFKAWADMSRNVALDFTPSGVATNDKTMESARANFKPRASSPDPLLNDMMATAQSSKPAATVSISRPKTIQQARLELPVVQEEQKIMENINTHPVTVVCGATGSGKTTQVPQMLLENGYETTGMIGVTQPRRVAATSVASRVAHELGAEFGKKVAYQIRGDNKARHDTSIKFMTDGILLREIQQDFILSKYSVIIIDEAHERSVNTDILIGMLSRIVPLRADLAKEEPKKHKPLKLVIMSATLSQGVDSFLQNSKLWERVGGPPAVVEAEGRQYPVTVHFARKTRIDYLSEVVEKVARGHRKLPTGGILVFLTGEQEITTVSKQLRDRLGGRSDAVVGAPLGKSSRGADSDDYGDGVETTVTGKYYEDEEDPDSDADIDLGDEDEAEFAIEDTSEHFGLNKSGRGGTSAGSKVPLKPHVLPLFAKLRPEDQVKVFQPAPEGHRLIILATNVAETSLTIPGIRYVFDSGRSKDKHYDTSTGVQTFDVGLISKASAEQRKGRAGRTGPGHVWRLYSSAFYENHFDKEIKPEILRTPLESTVLQLKAMDIPDLATFPFPTQPEQHQLEIAERLLVNLGALTPKQDSVSKVGREIMKYPVNPRFGQMIRLAHINKVVPHAVAIVAALAVGDLFIPEVQASSRGLNDDDSDDGLASDGESRAQLKAEATARNENMLKHQEYTRAQAALAKQDTQSDVMKVLRAVTLHAEAEDKKKICEQYSLRAKAMDEVQMLRRQLHRDLGGSDSYPTTLAPPIDERRGILNAITTGGFIDQIAIRADTLTGTTGFGRKPRRAIEVAYRTLLPSADASTEDKHLPPPEQELRRSVFIHSTSVLAKLSVEKMPQFIAYSHLSRAAPSEGTAATKVRRTRMHPLTAIDMEGRLGKLKNCSEAEMGSKGGSVGLESLSELQKTMVQLSGR